MKEFKNIPVIILHGWNLSADKFTPLVKEFKKRGFNTYSLDLPGFGKSEFPDRPYYLSDYVAFVLEYIRKNKFRKIILIGHSFGGRISVKLAAGNPKYLFALILTGAPGINPVPPAKIRFYLIMAKAGNLLLSFPGLSLIKDKARKLLYRIARASDFYNTNEKMRETFKNIIKENLVPYLSEIKVPTLLLWGADDKIVPLEIARKMNKYINNSEVVAVPGTRHGLPWTSPEKFRREVEKYLSKI